MFNKLQTDTPEASYVNRQLTDKSAALILLKLMQQANRFNIVKGNPKGISTHFGIVIGDFHLGIRNLKKIDFVRKYTKHEYMLNPDLAFNGDDKQYFIVKHMWNTQTSKGLRK
jgi:5-methylcytosine-specific restriction endonuclease McrBC GTP-binding regulatory subunit McrB